MSIDAAFAAITAERAGLASRLDPVLRKLPKIAKLPAVTQDAIIDELVAAAQRLYDQRIEIYQNPRPRGRPFKHLPQHSGATSRRHPADARERGRPYAVDGVLCALDVGCVLKAQLPKGKCVAWYDDSTSNTSLWVAVTFAVAQCVKQVLSSLQKNPLFGAATMRLTIHDFSVTLQTAVLWCKDSSKLTIDQGE